MTRAPIRLSAFNGSCAGSRHSTRSAITSATGCRPAESNRGTVLTPFLGGTACGRPSASWRPKQSANLNVAALNKRLTSWGAQLIVGGLAVHYSYRIFVLAYAGLSCVGDVGLARVAAAEWVHHPVPPVNGRDSGVSGQCRHTQLRRGGRASVREAGHGVAFDDPVVLSGRQVAPQGIRDGIGGDCSAVDVQAIALHATALGRFGGEPEVGAGGGAGIGEPSSSGGETCGGEDDRDGSILPGCHVEPAGQQLNLGDVGVGDQPGRLA